MPNSIATEITRITTDRNTIRTKFVALGIATSNADLDDLATAADGIVNRGAVDASVQEGESYTIPAGYHNGAGTVRGVSGGGGLPTAEPKAVNFIDYDGAIRYSYTAAEFAALTALPANPTHDGLTSQGWNFTLSNAQAYVAKYGKQLIGQMYMPADGKTHIRIHLDEGYTSPMLGCCPNGTVDVDWGDGTDHDTLVGTSTTTLKYTSTHNYAAPGDYDIKLTCVIGSLGFAGTSNANEYSGLLRYSASADARNAIYLRAVRHVETGSGLIRLGNNAFRECTRLQTVTIHSGVSNIAGVNAFDGCRSLRSVTIPANESASIVGNYAFNACLGLVNVSIPPSVTSIGVYAFSICCGLTDLLLPPSVTSIGNYVCRNCYRLTGVTVPDGVTSIGTYAFNCCYSLTYMRFLSQTPPTVSNASAFADIPTDCVIYVPQGCLEVYKSATNYPDPETYTYTERQII